MVTNDFYLSLLLNHLCYHWFYCGRLHALWLNENGQVQQSKKSKEKEMQEESKLPINGMVREGSTWFSDFLCI